MLEAVNNRLGDVEANSLYTCATMLDPRFKLWFFTEQGRTEAHLHLADSSLTAATNSSRPQQSTYTSTDNQPPAEQTSSTSTNSLWSCFDTSLNDVSAASSTTDEDRGIEGEVTQDLSEPLVSQQVDPAVWWSINMNRSRQLTTLARKFLASPPTSVPSERLFGTTGHIITDHCTRLLPENAETLIFLMFKCSNID